MAGLLLAAAGSAIGGSIGGTVLGVSAAVIGQVIGATVGSLIDQAIFGGATSEAEQGQMEEAPITSSTEGMAIVKSYGQTALSGSVFWASRFLETVTTNTEEVGGKGGGGTKVKTTSYTYSVSFALALCEGEIDSIGRVWLDGTEYDLAEEGWEYDLYTGTEDQTPNAHMESKEGVGNVPGYKGLAYIVFKNLPLDNFGNRIPQILVETFKTVPSIYGEYDEDDPWRFSVADFLRELAVDFGIQNSVQFDKVPGELHGVTVADSASFRNVVDNLKGLYMFELIESGGELKGIDLNDTTIVETLGLDDLVTNDDGEPLTVTRSSAADISTAVTLEYTGLDNDYETSTVMARRELIPQAAETSTSVSVVTNTAYAQGLIDRVLHAAWASRNVVEASLMPAKIALEVGDAVTIDDGYFAMNVRLQSIADGEGRSFTATSYLGAVALIQGERTAGTPPVATVDELEVYFMDLPLLQEANNAYAPYLAASADVWVGANVYSSITDSGFTLDTSLGAYSFLGVTQTPLVAATHGVYDWGNELEVVMSSGTLESRDELLVLEGANAMAIETGDDKWEIIQFLNAELIAADTYRLTGLLRGQLGTEDNIRNSLAAGARVVLLDSSRLGQLTASSVDLGREFYLLYGPSTKANTDATYIQETYKFKGRALRPYSVVHLKAEENGSDIDITWVRRSRIGGDNWEYDSDIPLGETSESYQIQIRTDADGLIRTLTSTSQSVKYTASQQTEDGNLSEFNIRVYQISDTIGRGIPQEITYNG